MVQQRSQLTRRLFVGQAFACGGLRSAPSKPYDVLIYGATSGGIVAAVAAAREGLRVALAEPGRYLGGMTTGGLGRTDYGRKETIGGYSLEFYQRVGKKYGEPVGWFFEPHIAELVFKEMLAEAKVDVFTERRLRANGGVRKRGARIRELFFENGTAIEAALFMDATYEGDLLKQAKLSYTVGREGVAQYDETLAGVRPKDRNHQFDFAVSGVDETTKQPLADIGPGLRGEIGAADRKVQAYNFRMCLTQNPANRAEIPTPPGYDPARWTLAARYLEAFAREKKRTPEMKDLFIISPMPNGKTDFNNRGPISTDYIGASWDYPEASYAQRAEIWQAHIDYTAGLFTFLRTDLRVPEPLRAEAATWGLAADEFASTNHWPHQLYVREARRLVGDFVMTQRDIQTALTKPDAIGMGSYNSDSHNVQRYVQADGTVQNEGNMEVRVTPYQIPYRVLLPKKKEAVNLLVPVCVSSSHVTYSTLRMEPVYMILGHAAGVAAKMALGKPVQDIDTAALHARLKSQGAVLEWTPGEGNR
ncbi:MAG: FAD-dependent oxidoreductase [Bryobacterales bacterium]|nr:FAD-dependent oxidoreductase [Bryobacterales bacterium]